MDAEVRSTGIGLRLANLVAQILGDVAAQVARIITRSIFSLCPLRLIRTHTDTGTGVFWTMFAAVAAC